jgi:hypothetical protein
VFWLAVCGGEKVIYAMNSQPTALKKNPFIFQLDKKTPMRFAWASLIFIYVLQYPLSQLLPDATPIPQYDWSAWLLTYSFVLLSVAIFMLALFVGLSGRKVKIVPTVRPRWKTTKRMGLPMVIMVVALFGLWTYWMVNLKIGMTIYVDFDRLPFRIAGILSYGRLFVQPMILAYIATEYSNSKFKWFVFLLLAALGAWVSLASGSRFVAIMFAIPMLLLFKGKRRYIAFASVLFCYITIASVTRSFYLPYILGGDFIQIYTNDKYLALMIEKIYWLPFAYIIGRPMGIAEVLMTLNFGDITSGFVDSLQSSLAYFLPNFFPGTGASIKNIYGLSDDAFGGFGLDMFSNFWVAFGGSPILYFFGLALIGWLLGKTYRQFAIGLARFGLQRLSIFVFALLFILIFEGRGFLFPTLLLVGWLFSRKSTSRILFGMLGSSLSQRALLPPQTPQSHPRI